MSLNTIYSFVPSVLNIGRLNKILFFLRIDPQKNFLYERRPYETVDEKSLS